VRVGPTISDGTSELCFSGSADASAGCVATDRMDDTPIATLQPNGSSSSIYYLHTDHLGTPRKITRPSDNGLMWRWDPDTFGSVAPNTNPAGLGTFTYNLRFPGQYALAESGLYYNYFRDLDPQTGRYIESDTIGLDGGINTYAYVLDSPIGQIDPLGLSSVVANLASGTLTLIDKDGNTVAVYPAGNKSINPTGNPNQVGCNCGAPTGTFPVQKPINTAGHPEYGPYFFPIGARGPLGQRLDIARQRGIGIHGGRRGPQSRTQGCIRVSDATDVALYNFYQRDPITEITITR
jgi:RHS repeat-associated protein